MLKQKILNKTLKRFYKTNPEITKALKLFEFSNRVYERSLETQVKLTILNKTTNKIYPNA